jgi:arginase
MPDSAVPLALIGVPLELGAGRRGCAMGPAALRTAEIAETLTELGRSVVDLGDIAPPAPAAEASPVGHAKHFAEIAAWTRAIHGRVLEALASGALPIALGGDHALAMGSTHGARSARCCAGAA